MSKKRNIRNRANTLINEKSSFAIVEAYKAARTNLMFKLMNDNNKKCIAITSSEASEGKTTTCINLANTFAQSGSNVLVIDADMRRPSVHRFLEVQRSPGLSDKICGFSEDEPCIYRTKYENLYVMPAGSIPPNPAELLLSNRMDAFLDVFKKNFDYIFIDTPPIGIVTDAAVIGSKCGGVLFVVRQDVSRKDRIKKSLDSLKQVGIDVYGFILNDGTEEENHFYRRRYGKYYTNKYENSTPD